MKRQIIELDFSDTPSVKVIQNQRPVPYTTDENAEIKYHFLSSYCQYGSIHKASASCGVSSTTMKRWLDDDEDFRENFEKMRSIFIGKLEVMAMQRAEESDSLLMFLLKANDPEKYNPRPGQVEIGNEPIVINFNTAIFNPKEVAMIEASSTSKDK